MARFWKWEGYRVSFCEKLLEASSTSNGADAKQLQDGPVTGQGWPHQWQWQHLRGNGFKKGKRPVQLWMEPEGGCDPVWLQLEQPFDRTFILEGSAQLSSLFLKNCTPWKWSTLEAMGRTHFGGLSATGVTPHWQRVSEETFPEEETPAETMCGELTLASIPWGKLRINNISHLPLDTPMGKYEFTNNLITATLLSIFSVSDRNIYTNNMCHWWKSIWDFFQQRFCSQNFIQEGKNLHSLGHETHITELHSFFI